MQAEIIQNKIQASIQNSEVHVIDTTGGGDHFRVIVISDSFLNIPTLKRHKTIYDLFPDELSSGELHALELKVFTTEEYNKI